ncbi:hypothetical protein [Lonepinella sp. BR2474]|uniref:hypothetical protein n=1 Tax=unclassified Lonepinella TaxID=2642006 RepID=UPI003F6E1B27
MKKVTKRLYVSKFVRNNKFEQLTHFLGYPDYIFSQRNELNYQLAKLLGKWREDGFIEIVDSQAKGFRAFGVAKDSNKYPNQYQGIYHTRIGNNGEDVDPILICRFENDPEQLGEVVVKFLALSKHDKMFDVKDNDLLKNFIISLIEKNEEYSG